MKEKTKKTEIEEMVKKAEADWRKEMEKDGAGHLLGVFREISGQIGNLQEQIDTYHPEEQMNRVLGLLTIQVNEIQNQLKALDNKSKEKKKDLI